MLHQEDLPHPAGAELADDAVLGDLGDAHRVIVANVLGAETGIAIEVRISGFCLPTRRRKLMSQGRAGLGGLAAQFAVVARGNTNLAAGNADQ